MTAPLLKGVCKFILRNVKVYIHSFCIFFSTNPLNG